MQTYIPIVRDISIQWPKNLGGADCISFTCHLKYAQLSVNPKLMKETRSLRSQSLQHWIAENS